MAHASRVKESTTATSTATIILLGTSAGYRTFASKHAIGETGIELVIEDAAGNWLEGEFTLTNTTLLTRTAILSSSNSDADVTFPAGVKTVFETLSGGAINKLQSSGDIAYSAAIPLTGVGTRFMPQQTVSGAIAFTLDGSPVKNSQIYLRLVANGVNAPTFPGMLEMGGSAGYDNRNGIVNVIQFFYDGNDTWYFITQAVGAVAVDTTKPTAVSASVATATPTLIYIGMSEVLDMVNNPPNGAFTIAGHPVTATSITTDTLRLTTSAAIVGGENLSVVYAPTGINNLKDPSGNEMLGFTVAITNNVAGADVTAPTLTSPTGAQTGTTTATIGATTNEATGTFYALVSVNATETAATVKASGATQAVTTTGAKTYNATGLTPATTYYGHLLHRDTAGNDSTVATSASFTTAAAATAPATMAAPVATAGDGAVSVAYVAPADGGSAITSYTATHSTGPTVSGTANPLVLTVANGVAGTVTITATNAIGTSAASPASNSVTPVVNNSPRFVSRLGLTESGTGPYSYLGTNAGSFSDQQACANKSLGVAGVDGSMTMRYEQVAGNGFAFGLQTSATYGPFSGLVVYMNIASTFYSTPAISGGTNAGANMTPAEGDILRLRRTGTAVYAEVARAASPTVFTLIGSWPTINAVNKYFGLVVTSDAKFTPLDAVGLV